MTRFSEGVLDIVNAIFVDWVAQEAVYALNDAPSRLQEKVKQEAGPT